MMMQKHLSKIVLCERYKHRGNGKVYVPTLIVRSRYQFLWFSWWRDAVTYYQADGDMSAPKVFVRTVRSFERRFFPAPPEELLIPNNN